MKTPPSSAKKKRKKKKKGKEKKRKEKGERDSTNSRCCVSPSKFNTSVSFRGGLGVEVDIFLRRSCLDSSICIGEMEYEGWHVRNLLSVFTCFTRLNGILDVTRVAWIGRYGVGVNGIVVELVEPVSFFVRGVFFRLRRVRLASFQG